MLFCADVGNTSTSLAIVRDMKNIHAWRMKTRERTPDEYGATIRMFLRAGGLRGIRVKKVGVCSVVPSETDSITRALKNLFGVEVELIDGTGDFGLKIAIDDPSQVGGDRIANAIGVFYCYGAPSIVVDLGTATTFDYVTDLAEYRGGVIAPGLVAVSSDLWRRARMLPQVAIRRPDRVIGTNTIECMQSGIFFGAVGMIEGIVRRMWDEIGSKTRIVLTGGYAPILYNSLSIECSIDIDLTIKGIALAINRSLTDRKDN